MINLLLLCLITATVSFSDNLFAETNTTQKPPTPPRAARSVHLSYPAPEGDLFYTEMVVQQSVNGSYFMACGWNTGYFGIQQLGGENQKLVIFSVWDPTTGDNAQAVPLDQRVEILFSGEDVKVSRFGGEGTGGKSLFNHLWKVGETNRFYVQAQVEGEKTSYTGFFQGSEMKDWKKLVTFRTRTGGSPLKGYYSFVEDFRRDTRSALDQRKASFGNGWVRSATGTWHPLKQARFTASGAEWEAKDSINAGKAGSWFFLETGGQTHMNLPLQSLLEIPHDAKPPVL